AAALPAAVRLLWTEASSVRRQLVAVAVSTAVAVPLTAALVVVAHGLTERQRNGHDAAYLALGLVWAAFALGCFVAWTALGVAIAKRIELPASVLRFETILAAGTTLAMVAMTAATAVWWAALALRAPSFFAGSPRPGASGSPLAPQLLAAQACMLVATVVAAAGSSRALRALRTAR